MPVPSLLPVPARIDAVDAPAFRLAPGVQIAGDPDAGAALAALIQARTSLESCVVHDGAQIELRVEPGSVDPGSTEPRKAESYRIMADAASVVITGTDAAGLFYGVQTLGQLITADADGFVIPAVRIEDSPRFAYRGVMLDVARHFHPVETVTAYIDRASGLKFNALHLHLTDDQGWRLQLSSRPELTDLASGTAVGGDAGGFYTQADYTEIVAHAARRHMIVVPEIDLPGHTHAVGLAYPEIVEAPVLSEHFREISRVYGGALPITGVAYDGMAVGFSSLKIREESAYAFVNDVLTELASITPGPYLHVGGDEALGTDPDDFALFMERVTGIAAGLGKTPLTWHEAGSSARLAPSTIGQYWGLRTPTDGMDEKARTFVRAGAAVILSPADAIYLDMKYDAERSLGLTWANGVTHVERAYDWDPASLIEGIGEVDILGVEAPMWTETIRTLADIDEMAFPRIAAAAEIAWSPSPAESQLRTWESFRRRVAALGPLWTSLGIGFAPVAEIPWITQAQSA